MNQAALAKMHEGLFKRIQELREAGQKEYAGGADAFGNFNRLAKELAIDRKQVLWIYAMKHKDGIASFLRGHVSQRESVHGRIQDLINYLMILDAMIYEEEGGSNERSSQHHTPHTNS